MMPHTLCSKLGRESFEVIFWRTVLFVAFSLIFWIIDMVTKTFIESSYTLISVLSLLIIIDDRSTICILYGLAVQT